MSYSLMDAYMDFTAFEGFAPGSFGNPGVGLIGGNSFVVCGVDEIGDNFDYACGVSHGGAYCKLWPRSTKLPRYSDRRYAVKAHLRLLHRLGGYTGSKMLPAQFAKGLNRLMEDI